MAPRIRIPAHVFSYSLAILPAAAYAMYWKRNHKSDEELEAILKENYATKIQGNRDKKEEMVKFFAAMKDPTSNPDQEKKMQEVLHGGRGDKKRLYAVDEKLYGTLEGVERRRMAEEEMQEKTGDTAVSVSGSNSSSSSSGSSSSSVKKRKKKKKKYTDEGHKQQESNHEETIPHKSDSDANPNMSTSMGITTSAVGVVGILAIGSLLWTSHHGKK